ncbi:class I SAM-dependent methyltransferase [Nonomuraea dietziae]|uniref:class I SAM-dependent methyltransferase n=1 Tax=Nonomuraea dietziae TaxID=65515 RepID=UPI003419C389
MAHPPRLGSDHEQRNGSWNHHPRRIARRVLHAAASRRGGARHRRRDAPERHRPGARLRGGQSHPSLLEAGLEVVAVDESAEMLAHVRGARTVCARAQELDLGERFDSVVLASYLVNLPDAALRHELLASCARHVAEGGSVLIQWQPPEAHDQWEAGRGSERDGVGIMMTELEEVSPGTFAATMRYTAGERVWTQSFQSRRLTVEDLAADLARAGLALDGFLTEDRTWARAVPA